MRSVAKPSRRTHAFDSRATGTTAPLMRAYERTIATFLMRSGLLDRVAPVNGLTAHPPARRNSLPAMRMRSWRRGARGWWRVRRDPARQTGRCRWRDRRGPADLSAAMASHSPSKTARSTWLRIYRTLIAESVCGAYRDAGAAYESPVHQWPKPRPLDCLEIRDPLKPDAECQPMTYAVRIGERDGSCIP